EAPHDVLLGVEVDPEIFEILELRVGRQVAQDGGLRLAGRTPRGVDGDQNRAAGLLCRRERAFVKRPLARRQSRRDGRCSQSGGDEQKRAAGYHCRMILWDEDRLLAGSAVPCKSRLLRGIHVSVIEARGLTFINSAGHGKSAKLPPASFCGLGCPSSVLEHLGARD